MVYTWENMFYRDLMVKILINLEPIKFGQNYIILDELDDSSYVVFLLKNVIYLMGYSVNKHHIFKIKQKN
jgi:hypothetical protein